MKSTIIEVNDKWLELKSGQKVFSSLEGGHPGGSIKDYMVRGELEDSLQSGSIKKGDWVAEISAGSTAISLATYAKKFDLKCCLFLPDTASKETIEQLKLLGAELHIVPMATAYSEYDVFLKKHPHYHPFNQMADSQKRKYYVSLGHQLHKENGPFDYIVGAVGTGHSLLGVAQGLGDSVKIVSAEPVEGLLVSGVRNLNVTHFGERDIDPENDFFRRIFLTKEGFFSNSKISTNLGSITTSDSFLMVLGAVKKLLEERGPCNILALGAKSMLADVKGMRLSA